MLHCHALCACVLCLAKCDGGKFQHCTDHTTLHAPHNKHTTPPHTHPFQEDLAWLSSHTVSDPNYDGRFQDMMVVRGGAHMQLRIGTQHT